MICPSGQASQMWVTAVVVYDCSCLLGDRVSRPSSFHPNIVTLLHENGPRMWKKFLRTDLYMQQKKNIESVANSWKL